MALVIITIVISYNAKKVQVRQLKIQKHFLKKTLSFAHNNR